MPSRILGSLSSGFATQAALAFSGILLARALGPADRGYLALLFLWPTILFQVADLGLPIAGAYYIAKDPAAARQITRSLIRPAIYQALAVLVLHGLVLAWFLPGRSSEIRLAGLMTLVVGPSLLVQDYALAILQGQQRFRSFNVLRALPAVLNAGAALAVWVRGLSLEPAALLLVVAYTVSAVGALGMVAADLPPRTVRASPPRRRLFRFGLRSFLGSLYPVESFRVDQVIVGIVLSPATLGLYVVSLAFTNLPRFIAQSIGMVAYPHIASRPTDELRRAATWKFFWGGVAISAAAVALLEVAVGPAIPLLFGGAFKESVPLARILLFAGLFTGARRVLAEALKGEGFPLAATIAELASWGAFAVALAVLVPTRGVQGVALAVAAAAAFSLIVLLVVDAAQIGRERYVLAEPPEEARVTAPQ